MRDKNSVLDTIDEIDILKTRIVGIKRYEKLDILNWEVDEAIPTSDIIWTELNKGLTNYVPIFSKLILSLILPIVLTSLSVFALIYLD